MTVAIALLLAGQLAQAASGPSPAASPAPKTIIANLASHDWQVRYRAVMEIKAARGLLREPAVRKAMVAAYLRGFPEARKFQLGESDAWQAYNAQITAGIIFMGKCCDAPLAYWAIVQGSDFEEDDYLCRWLAMHAGAYPALMAAAQRPAGKEPLYGPRGNAIYVLAYMYGLSQGRAMPQSDTAALFRDNNVHLSGQQQVAIRRLVFAAARDRSDPDRFIALEAVGLIGDQGARRLLRGVIRRDPNPGVSDSANGAPWGLSAWYRLNGGPPTPPYHPDCRKLARRSGVYAWLLRYAQGDLSFNRAWRTNAVYDLAQLYALSLGRPVPGPVVPTRLSEGTCQAAGVRLTAGQRAKIRLLVIQSARNDKWRFGLEAVGLIGDAKTLRLLQRLYRQGSDGARYEAFKGLSCWYLTNRLPEPPGLHP